jgi:exo-beta-1,3-glucanase (GH17 family)
MSEISQTTDDLIEEQSMAVAYSGFRAGQHPDRGEGANNPGEDEILEDLRILVDHGFKLIRLYDSGENSLSTLKLIHENKLPIKVLLGAWLKAEVSNHEGCSWLDQPIPDEQLVANMLDNAAELRRNFRLANQYEDIITAVNIGNEALVDWNDHMVPVEKVIEYVRQAKSAIKQPVTVADNYEWWIRDGAELAEEVDFLGVHTYPAWENKTIDEALDYSIENIRNVRVALPGKPIAVLEAGWATTASEFGTRASEANQARYFQELGNFAVETNTTIFFFEAFDEPWKGNPDDELGAEKHWGLFYVDRRPKHVMHSVKHSIN